ncbi:hypothetical protein [Larkinella soli]|uniref:hypothetical protein n=1 Tax=Larkinella soli TaxID=1770527 RepID=UPI000FFC4C59|nr:hypothetical protein [Larkinella soli]
MDTPAPSYEFLTYLVAAEEAEAIMQRGIFANEQGLIHLYEDVELFNDAAGGCSAFLIDIAIRFRPVVHGNDYLRQYAVIRVADQGRTGEMIPDRRLCGYPFTEDTPPMEWDLRQAWVAPLYLENLGPFSLNDEKVDRFFTPVRLKPLPEEA